MDWRKLTRHSIALSLSQCPQPDIEVKLFPGDALFIPAMWFHWITSHSPKNSMNVAINRWYSRDSERGCLECKMAEEQDAPPFKVLHPTVGQEPANHIELCDLEDKGLPVVFQFREKTLNLTHLMQTTIPVRVSISTTHQFASTIIHDVFPHLSQTTEMPLDEFFRNKNPHTYLLQCPIDGLNDLFGQSGRIPFKNQNLWVNFAEECESLNHCDEQSNILLQIQGTKTVRLWRPCLRDQLVMRLPVPSKELCLHFKSSQVLC